MSLLATDPEGYAKGCTALAGARDLEIDFTQLGQSTTSLIITGEEDKVSPPAHAMKLAELLKNTTVEILPDVGHWHVFEDADGVLEAVEKFLS